MMRARVSSKPGRVETKGLMARYGKHLLRAPPVASFASKSVNARWLLYLAHLITGDRHGLLQPPESLQKRPRLSR